MENRNYKTQISRCHSSQRLKFKQITNNGKQFNQLNSKYELYKKGSPNSYSQQIDLLKIKNLKSQITMLELPAIDYIIGNMTANDKQKRVNQRNYDLYPSLLKTNSGKYKQMLSQKQEIKDFILWFQNQYANIQKNGQNYAKKFEQKQTLITAGFCEMTEQVSKISKNRAEILKMLWNRQNQQVSQIIDILSSQSNKKQKTLLESISKIHNEYLNQISLLTASNKENCQNLYREKQFSKSCVGTLRIQRKRIKKLQYLVKKLSHVNLNLKKQNLNLIEQNTKLLMNVKQISEHEAIILNYRQLQIHKQRQTLKRQKHKDILKLANQSDSETPLLDLQNKKNILFEYFLERIKQNPDERALIREQCFNQEDEAHSKIQEYFKIIINKPVIQMQLLNEAQLQPCIRQKGINTQAFEQKQTFSSVHLLLDKGIQVQLIENNQKFNHKDSYHKQQFYHIIHQQSDQNIQKQAKRRIIQHRISRKNSLTLLQFENINILQNNGIQKAIKETQLNFIKKKTSQFKTNANNHHQENISAENDLSEESENQFFELEYLNKKSQYYSKKIIKNLHNRKSLDFKNFLQELGEKMSNFGRQQKQKILDTRIIKLEEGEQHSIKYSQLEDLIKRHISKNQPAKITTHKPEKSLNKILLALFRNVVHNPNPYFLFQLLDVIKNSYGNIKSVIWKFLSVISLIKNHHGSSSLLKIISLFLKINDKFSIYDQVNKQQLAGLYFKLFFQLTIKTVNQNSFNLWKSCTTVQKVKSLEVITILQQYFSHKKISYIQSKIQQFIAISEVQYRHKHKNNSFNLSKNNSMEQQNQVIKLNPIILYILEVYLIEKKLYYNSYIYMVELISQDGIISSDLLLWVFDLMGLSQQEQRSAMTFAFTNKPIYHKNGQKKTQPEFQHQSKKDCKSDQFYRMCVKFDFPIFQELSISIFTQFKRLPIEIQQKYYRMIGIEQWRQIREDLQSKFQKTCQFQTYYQAFLKILDKLQLQIKRGASIYGQFKQKDNIKRQEETFSLFYKVAIIYAHKNLIQKIRN